MSTYVYQPVQEREIRLLKLGAGLLDDELVCELKSACIDEDPEYEAVSYAWEGQIPDQPIICDGETLLVTKNLLAALRRFRRNDMPRVLWADGICINQADNDEKSRQVALMGLIYTRTQHCLVWLGEERDSDELAFHAAKHLYTKLVSLRPEAEVSEDPDIQRVLWQEDRVDTLS